MKNKRHRQTKTPSTAELGGTPVEGADVQPLRKRSNEEHSTSDLDSTTALVFPQCHRVLRPMRRCVEGIFEAGDYESAFPLLHAVILLNSKPSFLRGSVHQHYSEDQHESSR